MTIYNVIFESYVDGDTIITAVPCISLEVARGILNKEVDVILNESQHYSGLPQDDLDDFFTIERSEDSFFIQDNTDDYYEDYRIEENELVVGDNAPKELYYGD